MIFLEKHLLSPTSQECFCFPFHTQKFFSLFCYSLTIHIYIYIFVNFGDRNWPKPEMLHLAGAVEVNDLAQGALREFTQWLDRRPSLPIERRTLYH